MLLARHHGKAGTANEITGGLHVSADAGPSTVTGSSIHTKITQRKHLLFRVVGATKEMHPLQSGQEEEGAGEEMAGSPRALTQLVDRQLVEQISHQSEKARSTSRETEGTESRTAQ